MALTGLWTGGLSWRRLGVLIDNLPLESATFAVLQDADQRWSYTDHLLATVIDRLGQLTYVQVASKSKTRPAVPEPFPRPGPRPEPVDNAPGIAYLEAKRAEHAANLEGA